MNSSTSLYLFYSAKLGSQASIYFIWLVDSSSRTIAFMAAAVTIFTIVPFFHLIIHIFSAKPLSNSTFIAYLCFSFALAVLWYEPTKDGEQRILPFVMVTIFDFLALLIFLFQRQIGSWRKTLTSDIEQGPTGQGPIDDTFATPVNQGDEQAQQIRRVQVMRQLHNNINTINRMGSLGASTIRANPRSVDEGHSGPTASRGSSPIINNEARERLFAGVYDERSAMQLSEVPIEDNLTGLEPGPPETYDGFYAANTTPGGTMSMINWI